MADGNGRSVLVVEDDRSDIREYQGFLKDAGYELDCLLYIGRNVKNIPSKHFDYLIVDGLRGEWKNVVNQVDADKKIICSYSMETCMTANKIGLIGIGKDWPYSKKKLLEVME